MEDDTGMDVEAEFKDVDEDVDYDETRCDWDDDRSMFYDPGGRSALRAGVRDQPCPECEEEDRLTKEDVRLGYRCDRCADRAERGGY